MSAHVLDLLSAYLDHELSVVDAAAVREHLGACEACTRHLAHLAAVDVRLRDLPATAPAGYFDSFASRVRSRIETAPRAPFRVPTWSWALAAAVLIAVVLPRMVFDRHVDIVPAATNAPVAQVTAPREPLRDLGYAQTPSADAQARVNREVVTRSAPAPALPKREAEPSFAGTPPAAAPAFRAPAAPTPAPTAESGKAEAFAAEKADAAGGVSAQAASDSAVRDEVRLQMAEAPQAELEKDKRQGPSANLERGEAAAAAPGREDEQKKSRRAAATGTMAQAPASPADTEYRALESRGAGASLAQKREAWRAFAVRYPGDPRADEARVRVVALGVDLARQTGAEDDRAQAEKDAADYLARPDAVQKERVRSLRERLTP